MNKKILKKEKPTKIKTDDLSKIEILRLGKQTAFWQLIVEALTESIDFIEEQMNGDDMKDLTAEQYKFMNETYKAKKEYLRTLIATPDNLSSWIGTPDSERKDFDPYEKTR